MKFEIVITFHHVKTLYSLIKIVFVFLASVLPVKEIVLWAHNVGAKVLVDACQSVPHMVVDVQSLNADFLVASSHKVGLKYIL